MWWRSPFDTLEGRMGPGGFDIEGLVVPAYALFALALGVLAGLILRRTVAAMTLTLVRLRRDAAGRAGIPPAAFLAPLHRTVVALRHRAPGAATGCSSDTLVDAGGRRITTASEDLAVLHAQHAGIDPHTYLVTLGWRRVISYQPGGRFWTFQLIEAGIFVALASR